MQINITHRLIYTSRCTAAIDGNLLLNVHCLSVTVHSPPNLPPLGGEV